MIFQLYTGISRAREKVFILFQGNTNEDLKAYISALTGTDQKSRVSWRALARGLRANLIKSED
jgi:ATP-dependent exoDNAse (exonuclease V) alpha subunit